MINKFAIMVTLLLALLISVLMWVAFHYCGKTAASAVTLSQMQSDTALQTTEIAKQSFDFQKFNDITAAALQNDKQNAATVEVKQIEYRTLLKKEPTCALDVPTAVSDGLYNYANRLRASALDANTLGTHSAPINATASGALTYCQAVLWIMPLLATIDTANNHLASIRQIEAQK